MTNRRPLRSSGVNTIGWLEYAGLLPRTVWLASEYFVRIGPCWAKRGLRGKRLRSDVSLLNLPPKPQSRWVNEVDRHVESIGMDKLWVRHSLRTWQFASLLADVAHARDVTKKKPDSELLYVAAMLHDSGLFTPDPTRCFAVKGAAQSRLTAKAAGVDATRTDTVAFAIESHISIEPNNELGRYLQHGSLLDLTAMRLWKLDRDLVDRICQAHDRGGFPDDARKLWLAESARFPHGRAAFAKRPGGLILATHLAPLPK